jgi:hypothetical protein
MGSTAGAEPRTLALAVQSAICRLARQDRPRELGRVEKSLSDSPDANAGHLAAQAKALHGHQHRKSARGGSQSAAAQTRKAHHGRPYSEGEAHANSRTADAGNTVGAGLERPSGSVTPLDCRCCADRLSRATYRPVWPLRSRRSRQPQHRPSRTWPSCEQPLLRQ